MYIFFAHKTSTVDEYAHKFEKFMHKNLLYNHSYDNLLCKTISNMYQNYLTGRKTHSLLDVASIAAVIITSWVSFNSNESMIVWKTLH
jgi:hypothetical protein